VIHMTSTNNTTRRTATSKYPGRTMLIGKSRQGTTHIVYGDEGYQGRANCNRRIVCTANSHSTTEPVVAIICDRCFHSEAWEIN
jgi:hypothetical protein